MDRLNYQHLLYVWMVAKEGTVARAADRLRLTQSTLSTQIHRLEEALGEKLFARRGRKLELTESGRVAFRYADEIFTLGQEFVETLKGQRRPVRLVVGVLDALPKLVVRRLLRPAFVQPEPVRVICREDRSLDGFIAELVAFRVDIVLSDSPASPGPARLFSHALGETGTTLFAPRAAARRLRRGFPGSLNGEAMLLPGRFSPLHGALVEWLAARNVRPRITGEIDDSGLLRLLGETGRGIFAGPSIEEAEIRKRFGVEVVGRADHIRQRFYAITAERRIRHPAVLAIVEDARSSIFG